jgi:regulator of replication initiation timing
VVDLRSVREDNAALREQLAAQSQENAELRKQLAELAATNATLTQELAKLNERVGELLAVAKRKQRKPAADKPPGDAPVVEGEAKRTFEDRPKPPDRECQIFRVRGPAGFISLGQSSLEVDRELVEGSAPLAVPPSPRLPAMA